METLEDVMRDFDGALSMVTIGLVICSLYGWFGRVVRRWRVLVDCEIALRPIGAFERLVTLIPVCFWLLVVSAMYGVMLAGPYVNKLFEDAYFVHRYNLFGFGVSLFVWWFLIRPTQELVERTWHNRHKSRLFHADDLLRDENKPPVIVVNAESQRTRNPILNALFPSGSADDARLYRILHQLGPVVVVGPKGASDTVVGAPRFLVSEDDEKKLPELIAHAKQVVLLVGKRRDMSWELETTLSHTERSKIRVVVPEKLKKRVRKRFTSRLSEKLKQRHGVENKLLLSCIIPGIFKFDRKWCPTYGYYSSYGANKWLAKTRCHYDLEWQQENQAKEAQSTRQSSTAIGWTAFICFLSPFLLIVPTQFVGTLAMIVAAGIPVIRLMAWSIARLQRNLILPFFSRLPLKRGQWGLRIGYLFKRTGYVALAGMLVIFAVASTGGAIAGMYQLRSAAIGMLKSSDTIAERTDLATHQTELYQLGIAKYPGQSPEIIRNRATAILSISLIVGLIMYIGAIYFAFRVYWYVRLAASAASKCKYRYLAKRLMSGEEVLAQYSKPHVIYLRSFTDDQKPGYTQGATLWSAFLPPDSPDEANLCRLLNRVGPVVAIGRPGERLPPAGASRLYVGEDWQERVRDLISSSALVVVQLGVSDGVLWELEQATKLVPPSKLLVLVPKSRVNEKTTIFNLAESQGNLRLFDPHDDKTARGVIAFRFNEDFEPVYFRSGQESPSLNAWLRAIRRATLHSPKTKEASPAKLAKSA